MRVDLFDFDLPADRIALHPARPRDSARLLHVRDEGMLEDLVVRDLPSLLRAGDLLVLNDTRVVHAALSGVRAARGDSGDVAVAINLHRRVDPRTWVAFARPGKRLRPGDTVRFGERLSATVIEKAETGEVTFSFACEGAALDAEIAVCGAPPLPPYILAQRPTREEDEDDYQTIYARRDGAVAAPTAGLHFTEELFAALAALGVERTAVTLHVSAGTFLPVKTDDTRDHVMHAEWREVPADAASSINRAKSEGRRVIAIGTTALRSLESAVDADGRVVAGAGETDIFITPGYRFRVVDGLWTNFHLPRSTLFMLVSAFCGIDRMRAAYAHAIASHYRFYSFGDASLLWRTEAH
ncbi:MAG: tRNA preQ1(34) S-adenosylmethionine ribosyltransferase-isomerase QueA [Hyphomonadaceae bacterium]|nr:tRNA preQ1(34) S-adenosylmethionine ribosyltransferase-isomerase QueA [Hyphomonadaceae bacterium]